MFLYHARLILFVVFASIMPVSFVSLVSTGAIANELQKSDREATIAQARIRSNENIESDVEAGIAEVKAAADLDEALSASLLDLYKQADLFLESASASLQSTKEFRAISTSAADDLVDVKQQLEEQVEPVEEIAPTANADQLRQQLATAEAAAAEIDQRLKELAKAPAYRQKRLSEIPPRLSEAEKDLEEAERQLALEAPASETPIETRSRIARGKARQLALESEIDELIAEQTAYLATTDLLPLQRQLLERGQRDERDRIKALQQAIADRQRVQTSDAVARLKDAVNAAPEMLKEIAQDSLELAQRRQQMLKRVTVATDVMVAIKEKRAEVDMTLDASVGRLDAVGLTAAMGHLLRSKRDEFQRLRLQYEPTDDLSDQIAEYQVNVYTLEDKLSKIADELAGQDLQQARDLRPTDLSSVEEAQARTYLLLKQREEIEQTLQTQNKLLQLLLTTDTESRQLHQSIDQYVTFVDKNIFWIQSATAFSPDEFAQLPEAAMWLASPRNWNDAAAQPLSALSKHPLLFGVAICLVGALLVRRQRLKKVIHDSGKSASSWNATFGPTVTASIATLLNALAWPAVALLAGGLMLYGDGDTFFTRGLGFALIYVALFMASRHLLSFACRDGGLADKHFGWSSSVRKTLRVNLRWYTVLGGSLLLLMVWFHYHPDSHLRVSVARLSATLLFLVTAAFHYIISRPHSPIYDDIYRDTPQSKIYRYRSFTCGILTALPILFAALTMLGYLDTAYRLGQSLQSTMLLFVTLVVAMAIAFRWLNLHQAALAREQAIELRKQKSPSNKEGSESMAIDVGIEIQKEAMDDLPALSEQSRKLVFVVASALGLAGLFFVWKDVLPATELLDKVNLWSVGVGETIEKVSLRDVVLSLISIVGTIFAVKNIPALLELLVLRRFPIDSGARYAVTTILRYLLTIGGVIITLNFLSLPWTKLGWLLAAASVGLGFGLQEIFANFVSGIILLLERPVRVGDVVTIDGTTGIVSRIQMRATTVTSWDRKELVVPNKDLITGKLLNWSLSNVVNRMSVEVGVGYDADPDEVLALLRKVVGDHPDVMDEPSPLINFETFGDSSLNFIARFYLSSLDRRVGVTHEINTSIIRALREADIEIPFPKRDVNMRMEASPLESMAGGHQKTDLKES